MKWSFVHGTCVDLTRRRNVYVEEKTQTEKWFDGALIQFQIRWQWKRGGRRVKMKIDRIQTELFIIYFRNGNDFFSEHPTEYRRLKLAEMASNSAKNSVQTNPFEPEERRKESRERVEEKFEFLHSPDAKMNRIAGIIYYRLKMSIQSVVLAFLIFIHSSTTCNSLFIFNFIRFSSCAVDFQWFRLCIECTQIDALVQLLCAIRAVQKHSRLENASPFIDDRTSLSCSLSLCFCLVSLLLSCHEWRCHLWCFIVDIGVRLPHRVSPIIHSVYLRFFFIQIPEHRYRSIFQFFSLRK